MQDRFIRLSVSLARLQKVIQRIKTSGMGRIALKAVKRQSVKQKKDTPVYS